VASALILAPPLDRFRGLSIDVLTWLRWRANIETQHATGSPTVVVALDEETYRTPPFAGTPAITWTPEIARVLTAIIAGGAKVVGFDIVFPTSIEQSEISFDDGTLGARLRGFDRDFLRALALGAHEGKVVLGEAQHRDFPIMPSPGQRIAVGQSANIRSLNVYNDPDDVVRRIPLSVTVDGNPQSRSGRLCACIGVLAPPRFCPLRRGARAGRRRRSAVGDPVAAGQEISGASADTRLGRRQHAGREVRPTNFSQMRCSALTVQRGSGIVPHAECIKIPVRQRIIACCAAPGTRDHAAIASSRRLVTGGPNTPMTTKTIAIAPAMKLNTPMVP
jgi:hypothetical protein